MSEEKNDVLTLKRYVKAVHSLWKNRRDIAQDDEALRWLADEGTRLLSTRQPDRISELEAMCKDREDRIDELESSDRSFVKRIKELEAEVARQVNLNDAKLGLLALRNDQLKEARRLLKVAIGMADEAINNLHDSCELYDHSDREKNALRILRKLTALKETGDN